MPNSDHLRLTAPALDARPPLRWLKGALSAFVAYPIAERAERRQVRAKRAEMRRFYALPVAERRQAAIDHLADLLVFAGASVPYYRDLFASLGFDPESVRRDRRHIEKLPCLTKDIINEQGDRLLSRPLSEGRHYRCSTGGSTGRSCVVFYDQAAADYAAAVVLYARERVGKAKYHPETHFACRFPGAQAERWPTRETFKCLAMNRTNIFFDRFDDSGLEEMWRMLNRHRPYLAHAHPSTMYAIAGYVQRRYGRGKAFEVFESSGELLQPYMREAIERVLECRVVDRYGLAEMGVAAYEVGKDGLEVLESEVFAENSAAPDGGDAGELILTGLRNRLMPLIRYRTGDLARVEVSEHGTHLRDVVGRIHDVVRIHGTDYPTHHIMDVLQHRVGGMDEFQIDMRTKPPTLRFVPLRGADEAEIAQRIQAAWPDAFDLRFVSHGDLLRTGERAKFRHVVPA